MQTRHQAILGDLVQGESPLGRLHSLVTSGGARRVLLVDDHRDSVESLALLLALSGYEAEMAYDGFEAVRIATA